MNLQEKLLYIQTKVKAPKSLYNRFGNYYYRNAEGILEAVKPFLDEVKCTLTIADEIVEIGGRIYVKATAWLFDTQSREDLDVIKVSAYAREAETKKGMDDSQITGTASSYARKYALNGLFLLDDTKDADTDEFHTQTTQEKPKKDLTMAKELLDLAKQAGVSEENLKAQTMLDDLEQIDVKTYARAMAGLLAKINLMNQAKDGVEGKAN